MESYQVYVCILINVFVLGRADAFSFLRDQTNCEMQGLQRLCEPIQQVCGGRPEEDLQPLRGDQLD
jgi:hypothetical protein